MAIEDESRADVERHFLLFDIQEQSVQRRQSIAGMILRHRQNSGCWKCSRLAAAWVRGGNRRLAGASESVGASIQVIWLKRIRTRRTPVRFQRVRRLGAALAPELPVVYETA